MIHEFFLTLKLPTAFQLQKANTGLVMQDTEIAEFVMSPYRGVRYHLKEVRQADKGPKNAKELFNLRHSSLRNVIERIFGVLKRQWQILGGKGCEYSIGVKLISFVHLLDYTTLESNMAKIYLKRKLLILKVVKRYN